MRERSFFTILLATLCFSAFFHHYTVEAQVRQSSNYQIQSDSLNFGGGYSSSTSYIQESTGGEIATGPSDSASYSLRAGYQQMQEVYLALTGGSNINMTPPIPGIGGGTASGSTTVTAITDSPSGYQLTIEAAQTPAMNFGSNSIEDYTPGGADPDLQFSIASNEAEFGYSPFGVDTAVRFQTNGSVCNVSGTASSTACWDGLSTTAETIAQSTSPNHPAGATTTVFFKVQIGGGAVRVAGEYVATSTITLLSL